MGVIDEVEFNANPEKVYNNNKIVTEKSVPVL